MRVHGLIHLRSPIQLLVPIILESKTHQWENDRMSKPLAIDLYAGLGGWTEGLLAEGWDVIGFDIERHDHGHGGYPAQLVLQDVLTLHGRQFKDASLIVASPPCQEYSYMAMPWSRAKAIAAEYRNGTRDVKKLTALFDACFRIQREAIEAAGHHIPLVVENVRGACPWVGYSRWNYGSYHLWGDVPALMPIVTKNRMKYPVHCGPRMWSEREISRLNDGYSSPNENGVKQHKSGRAWFSDQDTISGSTSSKSNARKAASAAIAKIPFPLAQHIARVWLPR